MKRPRQRVGAGDAGSMPEPEYRFTDPVDDDAWPRITAYDEDEAEDAFPEGWGSEPTERDQAAIDAGNG